VGKHGLSPGYIVTPVFMTKSLIHSLIEKILIHSGTKHHYWALLSVRDDSAVDLEPFCWTGKTGQSNFQSNLLQFFLIANIL